MIHADIKLENLLMESSQREDEYHKVKICDFGLSQICDQYSGKSKLDVKCGTQGYMAPEVQAVYLKSINILAHLHWSRS